jgi:DNA-binding MarR family transcriptional regulator
MEDLPFEIGETAHALRRSFDRRAAVLGVTRAQWKVLFRLSRSPGMRQVQLADLLDIEPITLSRIIDRLAAAGLVQRVPDPADRRAWLPQLTEKARPLITELRSLGKELVEEAFSGIDKSQLEQMSRVLATVRQNVGRVPATAKVANL